MYQGDLMKLPLKAIFCISSLMLLFGNTTSVFAQNAQSQSRFDVYKLSPDQIKKVEETRNTNPTPLPEVGVQYPIIVITGFKPYRHFKKNPSELMAKQLHGKVINGYRLLSVNFPVNYGVVEHYLPKIVAKYKPVAVISLGNGRPNLMQIETVARNRGINRESSGPAKYKEQVIIPSAPEEIPTEIGFDLPPLQTTTVSQKAAPATQLQTSDDAGNDVCNLIFYLSGKATKGKAIFLHLPIQGEQTDEAYKTQNNTLFMNTIMGIIAGISK
jgi:pyroglutamyl-peptidase